MVDFITLSCPSCGSSLQITNDIDKFACGFCGNEHIVNRGGGLVSLTPVVQGLKAVKASVDKTTSELAIPRLKGEIAGLLQKSAMIRDELKRVAWMGAFSHASELDILNRYLAACRREHRKSHSCKQMDLKSQKIAVKVIQTADFTGGFS